MVKFFKDACGPGRVLHVDKVVEACLGWRLVVVAPLEAGSR